MTPRHKIAIHLSDDQRHILQSYLRSGDGREPLPVQPGSPVKEDCVYERRGMANLFLAFEPLVGTRRVEVTERKTAWTSRGSCGR